MIATNTRYLPLSIIILAATVLLCVSGDVAAQARRRRTPPPKPAAASEPPAPAPAPPAAPQDVPTMSDSTVEEPPPPLAQGWPPDSADIALRASSCEVGDGVEAARELALPNDLILPMVGPSTPPLPDKFLPVTRAIVMGRGDVLGAELHDNGDQTYAVVLKLNADGQRKATEYTKAHLNECLALTAGGRVLWTGVVDTPVEGDEFVISSFNITEAVSIIRMFTPK